MAEPPFADPAELSAAYAHCAGLAREADKDRYLATLFAPAERRPHLFALQAFGHEVARIREAVSGPMPGEVRLQWWRDVVTGEARGAVAGHPVAAALLDTIARFRLPQSAFERLIEARSFDLYDDPMPSTGDLEGYCGDTGSASMRLAMLVLADGRDPGGADAAGHAGVAYAVTGLLRAFPWHAARGQLYVPADILAAHGLGREEALAGSDGPALRAALAEMRALARRHLELALKAAPQVAAAAQPALLPIAVVEGYLSAMETPSYDPLTSRVEVAQWRRQWAIWRLARRLPG